MTSPTQSKVQLTKNPMLPAFCAMCRKSADGKIDFLDFQLDLEYYGVVIFCEHCAREMVTLLGYVPVAEVNSRNEQILSLTEMNRELKVENDGVRAALDSILVVRPDLRSDVDRTNDVDSGDAEEGTDGGKSKK